MDGRDATQGKILNSSVGERGGGACGRVEGSRGGFVDGNLSRTLSVVEGGDAESGKILKQVLLEVEAASVE